VTASPPDDYTPFQEATMARLVSQEARFGITPPPDDGSNRRWIEGRLATLEDTIEPGSGDWSQGSGIWAWQDWVNMRLLNIEAALPDWRNFPGLYSGKPVLGFHLGAGADLDMIEGLLGRKVTYGPTIYQKSFDADSLATAIANHLRDGRLPRVEFCIPAAAKRAGLFYAPDLWKRGAKGELDDHLGPLFAVIASFAPVVFPFTAWHELDLLPDEDGGDGSRKAMPCGTVNDFAPAYRQAMDLAKDVGATNIVRGLCFSAGVTKYAQINPGDEYVDVIHIDPFDQWAKYGSTDFRSWEARANFNGRVDKIRSIWPDKRLWVGETGVTEYSKSMGRPPGYAQGSIYKWHLGHIDALVKGEYGGSLYFDMNYGPDLDRRMEPMNENRQQGRAALVAIGKDDRLGWTTPHVETEHQTTDVYDPA